jgi:hypothetical protein
MQAALSSFRLLNHGHQPEAVSSRNTQRLQSYWRPSCICSAMTGLVRLGLTSPLIKEGTPPELECKVMSAHSERPQVAEAVLPSVECACRSLLNLSAAEWRACNISQADA